MLIKTKCLKYVVHVQRVIDHLSEDPELRFLALIDAKGTVIAHSDHSRVGSTLNVNLPEAQAEPRSEPVPMAWVIHQTADYGRVFEAVRQFFPIRPGAMPPRSLGERPGEPGDGPGFMMHRHNERRPMLRFFADSGRPGDRHYVVAGLDMAEFDQTLGRLQLQIVLLSLAMLLVGLGGWLSLSAVQGYRVSQKTIEDMQAYTSLLIARLPIGVIATDAPLTKAQAKRLAGAGHDGLARAIRPVHTMSDGDTLFALSTGMAGALDFIRARSPESLLLWASTTPVWSAGAAGALDEATTRRVRERNRLARKIAAARRIAVNDLFPAVIGRRDMVSQDGVHFMPAGQQALAERVARFILRHAKCDRIRRSG